jgi:xanthine dehydrogenase YagS FAD-binding subunit
MATVGGNIMQRTRCYYFRDTSYPCNKREPGTGCPAILGFNRIHAILGGSEQCIATNPSDMNVALAALDCVVHVQGSGGTRTILFEDFHLPPGDSPHRETALDPGELILSVEIPASPAAANSMYMKVRDRASYEFALVSVALALHLEEGRVRDARVAFGGVATRPWRAKDVEQVLEREPLTEDVIERAARAAVRYAEPRRDNAFKVDLLYQSVIRALRTWREKNDTGVAA